MENFPDQEPRVTFAPSIKNEVAVIPLRESLPLTLEDRAEKAREIQSVATAPAPETPRRRKRKSSKAKKAFSQAE
jgi:hypothetical protein